MPFGRDFRLQRAGFVYRVKFVHNLERGEHDPSSASFATIAFKVQREFHYSITAVV